MSFSTYALGASYTFANLTAKGAGAYVFWVVTFNKSTTTINSVVSDKGRAMSRLARLVSTNRVMEVWTIPHSAVDTIFTALVSDNVQGSFGVFIVHGVDTRNPFGAVFTAVNNAGTSSSLSVTDSVYDSYVFDFFATSLSGTPTPGANQTLVGQSSLAPPAVNPSSLSVSMKESYPGTIGMNHTVTSTAELLHAAVVIRSMFRRDEEYLAALEDESAERSFLAEIGAAEETEGLGLWVPQVAVSPVVRGTTTANAASFTHTVALAVNLLVVNVFSTTASTVVTYAGGIMRLLLRQSDIEWWYLINPPQTGTVSITNAGTVDHAIARSLNNANTAVPFRALTNMAAATGSSIPLWQPGEEWKDDLMLDAAKIAGTGTVDAFGLGDIQDSQVNIAAGTFVSGEALLSFSGAYINGQFSGGGWFLHADRAYTRIAIMVAPTMSTHIHVGNFSRVITGGDNQSGIQRNFDHVEVNGEALIPQPLLASMMAPEANGSYFYDSTTDNIYLRLPAGGNIDSFASVTLEFFILVGNRLVDFIGGDYYEPRLTGQLPSISGQANDLIFGVTSYPNGTIDVLNTDRFFDFYSLKWFWKNRKVNFFFGSENLTRDQYRQVGGMLIDDVQPGYETLAFQLRAQGNALQVNLLQVTLGTYFSPAELQQAKLQSDFFPYTVGQINNIEAKFFSTVTGHAYPHRYFIGSLSANPPRNVRAVHKITGVVTELVSVTDWFVFGLTIGTTATWNPDTYIILSDLGDAPAYVGETLRQLIVRAGVPLNQIDAHAFALLDQEEALEIAIYEDEQLSIEETVRLIEHSALVTVYNTADGLWSVRYWVPSAEDFDALPAISDSNLKTIPEPHFQPLTPFFEFVVQYNYNPFYQTFSEESSVDLTAIGRYKTIETYFRRTCLVKQADAATLVMRYHALQLTKPTTFELEEVGFNLLDLTIFDRFRLSLNRAPTQSGVWDNEIVQVLEFTKSFNPESIHVVVDNMRGLGAGVKVVGADGGAGWDTSNALDRVRYAFVADDVSERVDTTDPSTKGQAFAW